jgi:MipA family protein
VGAILVVLVPIGAARAQEAAEKPLFEFGVVLAGATLPDYPASDQNHLHGIPLPYVIYRGEFLQASANNIRGILFKTDRVTLDVSASGSVAVDDDEARQGMPGLAYLGEVGPRLNVLLAEDPVLGKIDFELPVRSIFSVNFPSVAYRGLDLVPEISYAQPNLMNTGGRLKVWVGPEFASARLMDYYYSVAPQYVVPGRSEYEATGGYLGSHVEFTYRYPFGERASIIGFGGLDLYSGATNEASPLFKKQYGISAALAFSYSFYISDERTSVEGDE